MKCYRCGCVLSGNDFCNSCGATVVVYKKVLRISNTYYNMGLTKVQVRDLSGAADLLRRSIKFNKSNVDARNLLGLVYFEMGEAVQAFSEWVISKNIKPEDNIAGRYIKSLQSNPTKLDTINQTIKKFNIALGYAREGNDDLAIIQLKKVLNMNPNLIKGHQLLALLYMKRGDYDRAKKPIMKSLKIDNNNALSRKYLNEIERRSDKRQTVNNDNIAKTSEKISSRKRFKPEFDTGANEPLSGYDVIIPKNAYGESNSGTLTVLNVIIGIVIGVAVTFFLLTPAKVNSLNTNHKNEVLDLNSQIAGLNSQIADLKAQVDGANSANAELQGKIDNANGEKDIVIADYEKLITAMTAYQARSYVECAEQLSSISGISAEDYETKYSESFKNMCAAIKDDAYKQAASAAYSEARSLYNSASTVDTWDTVISKLERCFVYDFKNIDYNDAVRRLSEAYKSRYQCAVSENVENPALYKEQAINGMQGIVDKFTTTEGISSSSLKNAQDALAELQTM
ncbi:MAG: hypothetical protein K2I03_12265 [Lachnospiraceae bacterium]|nr:hypothetical protein [Lachnospiraceae bacterium]